MRRSGTMLEEREGSGTGLRRPIGDLAQCTTRCFTGLRGGLRDIETGAVTNRER